MTTNEIKEAYLSGYKKKQIANMSGLPFHRIDYLLRRNNVKRAINTISKEKKDKVVHLYRWGYDVEEIRVDQRLPAVTIQNILLEEKNISRFV